MSVDEIRLLINRISSHFNEHSQKSNEFEVVSEILNNVEIRKELSTCIEEIKEKYNSKAVKSISDSNKHREEGNRLFRADKKGNALAASRCYTDAIIAAPKDSPALSLAHANRAAALVEFGYYFDAYCDCNLALQLGYPQDNQVKIFIRKAYCLVKMKNYFKLEEVLENLRDMQLSPQYTKQREDLEVQLKIIAELQGNSHQDDPHDYKVQNILIDPKKGRYMTAWKNYRKDDVVLSERAFAFVPINNSKCCSNCAKQHFIPYPCYKCSKIVYCSIKCKLDDDKIHQYECLGHRCEFFESIGITHLAMHALIRGLPEFLPHLVKCSSTMEIFKQVENIGHSYKKGYPEILALYNNFHQISPESICHLAICSIIGAYYLVHGTTFPDLYSKSSCSTIDWLTVLSALILRHVVQMIVNAQSNIAVILKNSYDYPALDDIWTQPLHMRKGLLHRFSSFSVNFSGIYPYLSLCNHSCEPTLRLNFDGDRVIAKTSKELKKGDEIFNTYVLEYRQNSKINRTRELSMHDFKCDCKHCSLKANDEEYLKFHRYRCRNSKCCKLFSPLTDELQWWLKIKENFETLVICPFCQTALDVDWFIRFDELFEVDILNTAQLKEAVKLFKYSQEELYSSELRQYMAHQIVTSFFKIWGMEEVAINESLFKEIGQVLKHWLDLIEEQSDVESVLYATTATFAIDLMARDKYFDFNSNKIRRSFDMLSTEIRTIFENYIKDYIGDKFDGFEKKEIK